MVAAAPQNVRNLAFLLIDMQRIFGRTIDVFEFCNRFCSPTCKPESAKRKWERLASRLKKQKVPGIRRETCSPFDVDPSNNDHALNELVFFSRLVIEDPDAVDGWINEILGPAEPPETLGPVCVPVKYRNRRTGRWAVIRFYLPWNGPRDW